MELYMKFATEHMLLAAFIQFALLGTLGEVLGSLIAAGERKIPFSVRIGLFKAFAWGVLGILIKYAFIGFAGFPVRLASAGLIPVCCAAGFGGAFAVSFFMNILFGPQMMFFHRFADNLITGGNEYAGMKKTLMTLLWFWIPAHTVTFLLPASFRIGVAALWSVVLGCIMGFYKRKAS